MSNTETHPNRSGDYQWTASLRDYDALIEAALTDCERFDIPRRIWSADHTVWKPRPAEITNRLGWLKSPEAMKPAVPEILGFVDDVRSSGFTHAVLLGMGGSSLAPEVFRKVFGVKDGYLDLTVMDTTDPAAVLACEKKLEFRTTLFIVATKSGGTIETFSLFKHFFNRTARKLGREHTGGHFVAITDPGSDLERVAKELGFRAIFLNDPDIGGRYSALSYFGLVPAALVGVDPGMLLDRAHLMARHCGAGECPSNAHSTGALLGVVLGELAHNGRDKLTIITSPRIAAIAGWIEQLIAESTGKEGKGILPVTDEPPASPSQYSPDRLFVYLRLAADTTPDAFVQVIRNTGQPVVEFTLSDFYDLGSELFRWEFATAVAGSVLGINPFDQPNVESAKILARTMMAEFQKTGTLSDPEPSLVTDGISVYASFPAMSIADAIKNILSPASQEPIRGPRPYVALQAYLTPNVHTDQALDLLRTVICDRYRVATTVGYGPRFLHSTGQLHKGDAGNGIFIQLTGGIVIDIPIPVDPLSEHSELSFGTLITAQALGDRHALIDAGRKILRFDLGEDVAGGLQRLCNAVASE